MSDWPMIGPRSGCRARRDGDSLIVLRGKEQVRVRLKEIDAPERNQPFGKRSGQSLSDMCAKKRARVSWSEQDRNGRTLGRV